MARDYVVVPDLRQLITSIQPESIISRQVYKDEHVNVTVFGFDAGQALSEHTASQPATIQILDGEATITLGEEVVEATIGTWIHMLPNTRHSVVAKTPLIMLLTLLK
ncbi:MAG: cupin domain-containing protein [Anaerolineae bacterium]|nr:cupin domain-containing protein [Anaerolineae bacterium]